MRKLCQKSLAVLLSVLMLTTGIIPAFATDRIITFSLADKYYAGTSKPVTATITGLTLAEAESAANFEWSITGDSTTTITNNNKKNVTEEGTDTGIYTVKETANISFSSSACVSKELTVTAKFGEIDQQSTTITPVEPIKNISIEQVDNAKHAYYDKSSSYLYVDEYSYTNSDEVDALGKFALLKLNCEPITNSDTISTEITNHETPEHIKCVSCDKTDNLNEYKISVSNKSAAESQITFVTDSGFAAKRIIYIKKCIPLTSFNITANGIIFSNSSIDTNTLTEYQSDPIDITITDPSPKSSNDNIKYTLYDQNGVEVPVEKYKIEYSANSARNCTLSISEIGKYKLVASAVSNDGGHLDRTVTTTMNINITEVKPITDVNFKSNEYTIYTLRENFIELKDEINVNPAMGQNTDEIVYTSDNPDIASVDSKSGKVTAHKSGIAKITAKSVRNGIAATCSVKVIEAINTISLSTESGSTILPVEHKGKIVSTISPAGAQENISYTSDRPEILTVDEQGNIEAISYNYDDPTLNNVKITATSDSNAIGTITITVQPTKTANLIDLSVNGVGNAAFQTIIDKERYSIYKGDTVSIQYNAITETGETSNDVVAWRVNIENVGDYNLNDPVVSNYLSYNNPEEKGNIISITSKATNDLTLIAYAIKGGQNYTDYSAIKTVTIQSNEKTTKTSTTKSSILLPIRATTTFEVSIEPNTAENTDKIVVKSSNDNVASISTYPIDYNTIGVIVYANGEGDAVINCYACYDENNPEGTTAKKAAVKVTVCKNIEDAQIEVNPGSLVYTGKAQVPSSVIIKHGDNTLTYNIDYTLKYENNVNTGVAAVTVTGRNNYYQGVKTAYFSITQKQITDPTIAITSPNVTYNGKAQTPIVTVKDNARRVTLKKDIDYTVSYSNNFYAGTGYMTVTGIGNYTGVATIGFNINQVALKSAKISGITTVTGNYKPQCPVPTITCAGLTLTNGVDYVLSYANNVNPGKATVTITGIGNFTGTREVTFTINNPIAPKGCVLISGEFINKKQKKASLKKVSRATKSFKAYWKKVKGISGYEIQYSTSKKFTKKTSAKVSVKSKYSSKVVKKLKGKKKYYVRIRTYRYTKFNGKKVKVYSSWSKVKTVKTK